MLFGFFPSEFSFFDLFDKQVDHAAQAARLFTEVTTRGEVDLAMVERMRDVEHQGDEAAHTIIDRLNRTFITPFDREDIYTLAKETDSVTDMLNTIVRRLHVYRLCGNNPNLVKFAVVIDESVGALSCAVKGLRHMKDPKATLTSCVEVHRLENVGDAMRDAMLANLFETERDPIAVIKWKEIYQDAETVLDVCEDVAHVVESILVKHN